MDSELSFRELTATGALKAILGMIVALAVNISDICQLSVKMESN